MTTQEAVTGLNCPRCGGIVPIPEGQAVVICPYCDQRSAVIAGAMEEPRAAAQAGTADGGTASAASADASSASAAKGFLDAVGFPAPGAGTGQENDSLFEGFPFQPPVQAQQPPLEQRPLEQHTLEQRPLAQRPLPTDRSKGVDSLRERRGVLRYQAPLKVTREQAIEELKRFLSGRVQVARDAANASKLSEVFLVHLPFWAVWGRGVAYAFGQQKVGSGDKTRYEPREKKVVRELSWNSPACEVGEFGVRRIALEGCPMQPFRPDELHRSGMVFEPVGSPRAALEAARKQFEEEIRRGANLSRVNQLFTRLTRPRLGLLYYPLWVLRYHYRGRAFQVVVDGVNGGVLYGKAPGSVGYRAGVLVAGMAVGSVVTVDVPALIMMLASSDSEDSPFAFALGAFVAGLLILGWSYRTFRHAEHYEYHRFKGKTEHALGGLETVIPKELQDITGVVDEVRSIASSSTRRSR